jgi:hypothetical protein
MSRPFAASRLRPTPRVFGVIRFIPLENNHLNSGYDFSETRYDAKFKNHYTAHAKSRGNIDDGFGLSIFQLDSSIQATNNILLLITSHANHIHATRLINAFTSSTKQQQQLR